MRQRSTIWLIECDVVSRSRYDVLARSSGRALLATARKGRRTWGRLCDVLSRSSGRALLATARKGRRTCEKWSRGGQCDVSVAKQGAVFGPIGALLPWPAEVGGVF
ncbi:hypothetical protein Enr13x_36550 [Stieleria neptunia]|uniref:Uncharacterized protein n=1 Tax=Stieleria neptunia TaxID=2527979 RepID=A0A518HSI7_9BACT|nr:hypothetical protein Enr13x_36550 [Stieleria neptunia]